MKKTESEIFNAYEKSRGWAYVFLLMCLPYFGVLVLLFVTSWGKSHPDALWRAFFFSVVLFNPIYSRVLRCPACRKTVGSREVYFCPYCGVQLRPKKN